MDGGFKGGIVCQRRPYNREILGVWFTEIYIQDELKEIYIQDELKEIYVQDELKGIYIQDELKEI